MQHVRTCFKLSTSVVGGFFLLPASLFAFSFGDVFRSSGMPPEFRALFQKVQNQTLTEDDLKTGVRQVVQKTSEDPVAAEFIRRFHLMSANPAEIQYALREEITRAQTGGMNECLSFKHTIKQGKQYARFTAEIEKLQTFLTADGADLTEATEGVFDAETAIALKHFQQRIKQEGLFNGVPSGVLDLRTRNFIKYITCEA